MDFKLEDEFVEQHKLTPEQVQAISGHVSTSYIPELKKGWDGKANEQAEAIIQGVIKNANKKLGVELERNQGEKHADYLTRLGETYFSKTQTELETKKSELEEKLKNFKGSEELKGQLQQALTDLDSYKQQVAKLEPLKGLDKKYEEATKELTGLKLSVSFNKEKPNFPDTVNKYEAEAKWNAFKQKVLDKNTIELVDGVPTAIDKENVHKTTKLSDLVKQDEDLNKLLEGRQQKGTGADPKKLIDIEGIPFKVPENATSEEKTKLVKDYLTTQGISVTDSTYSKKFSELYAKISSKKAA